MAQQLARNVKSAQRVLEILEYFDLNRREATVMELARSLNYPQSSTSELLQSMARMGYLECDRYKRAYTPTARVAVLGSWVDPMMIRGGPALTLAEAITRELGQTVTLSNAKNFSVMHVHVALGSPEHVDDIRIGGTMSLVDSVPGKVMLTSFRKDQIERIVRRTNAESNDPERCVRLQDVVEEVNNIRSKGWLSGSYSDELCVVSTLLPSWPGMDRLVLTVFMEDCDGEGRCEEIAEMLKNRIDFYLKHPANTTSNAKVGGSDNIHYLQAHLKERAAV